MTESSIDTHYRNIIFQPDKINHDNPHNLPEGFHYVSTSTGKVLAFHCGRCKLHVVGAPDVVKHCATESRMPTGLAKLVSRLKTVRYNRLLTRWETR